MTHQQLIIFYIVKISRKTCSYFKEVLCWKWSVRLYMTRPLFIFNLLFNKLLKLKKVNYKPSIIVFLRMWMFCILQFLNIQKYSNIFSNELRKSLKNLFFNWNITSIIIEIRPIVHLSLWLWKIWRKKKSQIQSLYVLSPLK